MFIPYRNSQKRIYGKDYIYFITTKTFNSFPYFREEIFCQLFISELKIIKILKVFKLFGFVIIPNHVHLLIQSNNDYNVSNIMHFLKRHFSRNANIIMGLENDPVTNEGDNGHCRLRYGCLNKQIISWRKQFTRKYGYPQYQIPQFRWQKSYYDHIIRNEKDFNQHLNYIAMNCIKHSICKDETNYYWSFLNPQFSDLVDF